MSLSQRATCRILSGHKESTSLFEAAEEVGQKRQLQGGETTPGGRKGSCREVRQKNVAEKVAATEIIEKANPRYRAKGGKHCGKKGGRVFLRVLREKSMGRTE